MAVRTTGKVQLFHRSDLGTTDYRTVAMSKLNVTQSPHSAVTTTDEVARTAEGGRGFVRDAKSELFLLAVSNMVGEDTFYEGKSERDARYRALVRQVAVEDSAWLLRFIPWLRNEANMRTASVVAAAEAVYALRDAGIPQPKPKRGATTKNVLTTTGPDGEVHTSLSPGVVDPATPFVSGRQFVDAAISRADEPGELLAYCLNMYGRKLPMGVKKGTADAVQRMYNEFNFLKWDSDARAVRFADVIELTHPAPKAAWQGTLFKYILDARHGHATDAPPELQVLAARAELMAMPVEQRREFVRADPAEGGETSLKRAGMTWESLAGWLQGPMDKAAWEAMIPNMGYMALLRNLRNFDDAGVSDEWAKNICFKLADPEQVARSRQLPLRFVSAYKAAPSLRWAWALEQAVNLSLNNIPALKGRTLILVDRSGSMWDGKLSERSSLNWAEGAALFGSALALRAENADLVQFGTTSAVVPFRKSDSLLKMPERFGNLGGTYTDQAVQRHYDGHTRVVIVTDEQAHYSPQLPTPVSCYTWNLAGYRVGHSESGKNNRHTFGGLSDAAFTMLSMLENHREGVWPF